MISLLAKMIIKDGRESDFQARFAQLAAKVLEREPGTLLFKLTRSRKAPNEFHVIEFYSDSEAIDIHAANLKTDPLMAGIAETLAEAPKLTVLDDILPE